MIEIPLNNLEEILVFKEFPDINYGSEEIKLMNLNIFLINKLLHIISITEHLNIYNKEYYL
jgi:hypothetical protein